MTTQKTGYPSIDKPWLKYYSREAINSVLPEMTIYQYIWENNKDHLNDIAIVYFERRITFREMFRQIDRCAAAFASLNVKKNDVVTLMVINQPETIYCLYALNKIGAVSCMINVLSSPKEIVHYMEECNSKFLIVLDALFDKAHDAFDQYSMQNMVYLPLYQSRPISKKIAYRLKVKKPVCSDKRIISWDRFVGENCDSTVFCQKDHHSCAIIGHTGGTTGTPKGVMLSDYAVNAVVAQYKLKFVYEKSDTFMNMIIPFAVYGIVINIHLPLALGIAQIIIPKVDPKKTDILFEKYKPNHVGSIPNYWEAIASSTRLKDMNWLKTAGAGGSGMTPELERRLNEKFHECNSDIKLLMGYGLSEVGATVCTQVADCVESGSAGIPLVKNVVAVFDSETGREKQYYEVGEICIQSPSIMLGYVGNPSETEHMIRVHPDGQVWLHTGDLGYINENGSVFINGRMKRIYLTQKDGALAKIFPDRIERHILQNPAIIDCCVVCIKQSMEQLVPIAYVEINSSFDAANVKKEIIDSCKEGLPEYAVPVEINIIKAFPRTSMGKIDYHVLEEMAKRPNSDS